MLAERSACVTRSWCGTGGGWAGAAVPVLPAMVDVEGTGWDVAGKAGFTVAVDCHSSGVDVGGGVPTQHLPMQQSRHDAVTWCWNHWWKNDNSSL